MTLNTKLALGADANDPRGRDQRNTASFTPSFTSGAGDQAAAQALAAQRQSRLSGAGDVAAAQRFIAEREARLSGAGDELAAQSIIADRTSGLPSPSTIQANNAVPAGSTTPSLATRQNQGFSSLSPRPYFRTDPGDNSYDFLSGQKVRTGIGTNPLVNVPRPGANTAPPPGSQTTPTPSPQIFYNEFGDSYTETDKEQVEKLRSFNEDLGGGEARAKLTSGERAYAISAGYI